jgi:hypothetical protein
MDLRELRKIIIFTEGGLVTEVMTNFPALYRIIDYDVEGLEPGDVITTPHGDKAYRSPTGVTTVDEDATLEFFACGKE